MKRLRIAEWLVLAGAIGLIVTLSMDWYDGGNERDVDFDRSALVLSTTGWAALGWLTIALLVICIAAGLLLFTLIAAGARDAYTLPPGVILVVLGLPTLLVLLIVVTLQPGLGAGLPNDAVRLEPVGCLGIACAFLLVGGGLASLRDERVTGPERIYRRPPARPAPPA